MTIDTRDFSQGKYDRLSDACLQLTKASMAIVMIIDGDKGNGFSASCRVKDGDLVGDLVKQLPTVLRRMAELLEAAGAGQDPRLQ